MVLVVVQKNGDDAMCALRNGLLAGLAAMFLAIPPAKADVDLDVNELSLVPGPAAQPFTLDMTLTNNAATAVSLYSWQFTLNFSPAIPAGQVTLTGTSQNLFSAGVIINPAVSSFVTTSVTALSTITGSTSVPAHSSVTLVKLDMLLAPNAFQDMYHIAISGVEIASDEDPYHPFLTTTVGTGHVQTPEPSSISLLVIGGAAMLLRRREISPA